MVGDSITQTCNPLNTINLVSNEQSESNRELYANLFDLISSEDDYFVDSFSNNSQPRSNVRSYTQSQYNLPLSNSQPRPQLQPNHSWEFHPEFLANDFSRIGIYQHIGLERITVDIDQLKSTILHGKMNINLNNIPSIQKERQDQSKYAIYRTIFKVAGRVLRQLAYNDQGMTNANIVENKLGIQSSDDQFIKEQGENVYHILSDIAQSGFNDANEIGVRLEPIVQAYIERYKGYITEDEDDNQIINDNIKENCYWEIETPRKKSLNQNDLMTVLENIKNAFAINKEEEEEEEDNYDFDFEEENCEFEEEEEEDTWIEDYKKYLCSQNEETFETENENLDKAYNNNNDNNKNTQKDITVNKSNFASICKGRGYYLLGCFDYLCHPENYQSLNISDSIEKYCWDTDDNQFIAENYNWRDRIILDNADEILNTIQQDVLNYEQESKSRKERDGMNHLKQIFYRDFIRYYIDNIESYDNREIFCLDFLQQMQNPERTWKIIKDIISKINSKNKKKKDKKKKDEFNFISKDTLLRQIRKFEQITNEEEKRNFLVNGIKSKHGGTRESCTKVSKETLLCLIVLVLDFPNLSASSMARYINSRYGPNYQYDKHISARTVQRYLSLMKFTVKKALFAPPNRNSIGLRIFRVAWSRIIQDILMNDNVLLCFVDEAAVTDVEGRLFGRAYASITPVMNVPLQKVKLTIIAMVIPCYGSSYP